NRLFLLQPLDSLDALDSGRRRRAVVVGAGYIGVEMAEAMLKRGFEVTVLNRGRQPMATLDPDMGELVHEAMDGLGITTVNGASVTEILTGPDGRVSEVATEERTYPADVVVLGIGVEPEAELAREAGLVVGAHGGILTDLAMRAVGHENIWAGGDCVEVLDLVAGRSRHVALGTHANKHGQVIGSNVGGGYGTFPGVVGTAVSKVCDLEIARTGLREKDARAVGLRYVTATIESTQRAGLDPYGALGHVRLDPLQRDPPDAGRPFGGRVRHQSVTTSARISHSRLAPRRPRGCTSYGHRPSPASVWPGSRRSVVFQPCPVRNSSGSSVPKSHGVSSAASASRKRLENGLRSMARPSMSKARWLPGAEAEASSRSSPPACSSVRKKVSPSAT
ncbi:FAD-dependent oxidoreductase, partial [Streptomyces halstedii]|uniref:FAD-dependent oxidoreductase n=1 Tax=Streptomyces halstedii TaxID=1944 RepID=UPI0033AAD720